MNNQVQVVCEGMGSGHTHSPISYWVDGHNAYQYATSEQQKSDDCPVCQLREETEDLRNSIGVTSGNASGPATTESLENLVQVLMFGGSHEVCGQFISLTDGLQQMQQNLNNLEANSQSPSQPAVDLGAMQQAVNTKLNELENFKVTMVEQFNSVVAQTENLVANIEMRMDAVEDESWNHG